MTSPAPRNRTRVAAVVAAIATTLAGPALWPTAAHAVTTADWHQASGASPSPRVGASMAYDPATGKIVLFGGIDESGSFVDQTWVWDGSNWTQAFPATSPSPRFQAAMAYDTTTNQLVLFGGAGTEAGLGTISFSDTWVWDGSNWTQQAPVNVPIGRYQGALADDPATGQLVLFGGSNGPVLNDTWTWDGTDWTQQTPAHSPSPRNTVVAYNPTAGNVVLFGGYDGVQDMNDTWTWDGTDWTQQTPAHSPSPRKDGTLTNDPSLHADVLFGGLQTIGGAYPTDTWTWNGTDWTQATPANSPPGRSATTATFDQRSNQLVLFGGYTGPTPPIFGDTWLYDAPITPAAPAAPAPQVSRLQGADRDGTAIAVSQAAYPAAGSAHAVVLARDDIFVDALVGGPLAARVGAPLLLTPSHALNPATSAEIQRVLPARGTIYLLGDQAALSAAVAAMIGSKGYTVKRIGGADRYATSVAVAAELGDPSTTFIATGTDFPDALAAGPAAASTGGTVVLSIGPHLTKPTADYLNRRHGQVYAIGGPACQADPGATCIAGRDRYSTATNVAITFLPHPAVIGMASGVSFSDALASGAYVATRGGALLFAPPNSPLPTADVDYLDSSDALNAVIFGGSYALPNSLDHEVAAALS